MEREYELFEQFPDGSPLWRGHASGLEEVRQRLQEIAKETANECFAMYLPTKEIVARLNARKPSGTLRKRVVFQIGYDAARTQARTEILRLHGYEVISVIGNEAAKLVLDMPQACDLFMVGHAAPEERRAEMVAWLKAKYPKTQILALNSPQIGKLPGADYNVKLNGPELWLPLIASALQPPQQGLSPLR